MSAIGEAIGFGKSAEKLRAQLEDPKLSPEERQRITREALWYEAESAFCHDIARQEAMADAAEDPRDDYRMGDPDAEY